MNTEFEVIVVGGGPAGSAAAEWLARKQVKTALIDRGISNSYLGSFAAVDFLPCSSMPISGREILERSHAAAKSAGAHLIEGNILEIESKEAPFTLKTEAEEYRATRALLLATGAAHRSGALEGEGPLLGKGVWHDVDFGSVAVRGKTVTVVGKSLHAAEEAMKLLRIAEKIFFIIPSSKLDIPQELFKQLEGDPKIELHFSTSVKRINGSDQVSSLTILSSGQEKELPLHAVFTYVHDFQRMNECVHRAIEVSEKGEVLVDDTMLTSLPGIFACGDILCARPQHPTVTTAQGIIAAMNIANALRGS